MTARQYFQEACGYELLTTYWDDFTIAEAFGENAIEDTYNRALLNDDYKMLTELCLILNHKLWQHYNGGNEKVARLYDKLWKKCDNYCYNKLKGDELSYFFRTLD